MKTKTYLTESNKETKHTEPEFMDIRGAAALAKVSIRTIANWHSSRAISAIRLGRVLRFRKSTFMAELERFSTTAAS